MQYRSLGMMGYLAEIGAAAGGAIYFGYLFSNPSRAPIGQPDPVNLATPAAVAVGMLGTIAGILVSLVWLYAGREKRSGLFKATGVVGLFAFVVGYALTLWSTYVFSLSYPEVMNQQVLGPVLSLIALGGSAGVLEFIFVIMEIVTFFSAAGVFQSKYFRYAGFGRIFAIVGGIVAVVAAIILSVAAIFSSAVIAGGAPPSPQVVAGLTEYIFWGVGVFTVLWVIPDVFAFLGFRGISKEQVPLPVGVVPEASGGAIGVTFPEDRRVDAPFPMRKSGCAS